MIRAIFWSPINVLLVAAPVSWVLAATIPGSHLIFMTAAAALIPLAGLIGLGTEQLARRSGPGDAVSRRRRAGHAGGLRRSCRPAAPSPCLPPARC